MSHPHPGTEPFAGSSSEDRSLSSVGDLISDISRDLSQLMRQEAELAKAEVRESAARAGKGAGMLGGAGVAAYMALLFLSVALWWVIGNGIGRGWAALIVAVLWAIVAAVLAAIGRKKLKEVKGIPQTQQTVQKIPDALKGNEESS